MPAALIWGGGPLEGSYAATEGMVGIVAVFEDIMWVYDATEVHVNIGTEEEPEMEFRGYRFICRNPEGEPNDPPEGFEIRQVTPT